KRLPPGQHAQIIGPRSVWYRAYLFWLAVPPLALLLLEKPVGLIMFYAIIGALFMPFLSGTLLYMNSRRDWVGEKFKNGWLTTALLVLSLLLFGYLCLDEMLRLFN
ncbi:divalent metal cation transporter, partial [candidate division KSB1 bacterium]|nr:divalent metal cation transporter [candidate division KSB1 bacterium]